MPRDLHKPPLISTNRIRAARHADRREAESRMYLVSWKSIPSAINAADGPSRSQSILSLDLRSLAIRGT